MAGAPTSLTRPATNDKRIARQFLTGYGLRREQGPMTDVRRLTAILFSDIQGYSRMMQLDEAGTLCLLEEHNNLILPIIGEHNGRLIKTVGDAALSVYDSCLEALHAAVKMQESLAARAEKAEGPALRVRIGIHLGETVFRDGDVFGNVVNIAGRLQPLADPGGICFSRAVFDQLSGHFADRIVRVGPATLKNIAEPVEIFRMQVEGSARPDQVPTLPLGVPPSLPVGIASDDAHLDFIRVRFGSANRRGHWRPRPAIRLHLRAGAMELDFRQAEFSGQVRLDIDAIAAAIEILLPPDVHCETRVDTLFASVDGPQGDECRDAERSVLVVGRLRLGALDIKKPGGHQPPTERQIRVELRGRPSA